MKIYLNLKNPNPLARHLVYEGDLITPVITEAELVISDKKLSDDKNLYIVGGDFHLASTALDAMGFRTSKSLSYDFVLTKWFNSHDWLRQLIVGIPLSHLMNDNLGYDVRSGYATRFCSNKTLNDIFNNSDLVAFLKKILYHGFVSILMTLDLSIVSIVSNVPSNGIYGILEGVPGKISDFLTLPEENELMSSWTSTLMLSCYPFPFSSTIGRQTLHDINKSIEKHFWFNDIKGHSKALYTDSSLIGWSTSWGPTIGESNRRALRTCRNIKLPFKQYRTDLAFVVNRQWGHLQALGLSEDSSSSNQLSGSSLMPSNNSVGS